ncbi:MAG: hypothetical protein SFV51_11345 [Bryobacteraceae bacterium]|nr:hypothetical protein [Bryobacteraceae bacterium]
MGKRTQHQPGDTRPAVIPIDTGRQLFVDDYLIARTDLRRQWHSPVYHPSCPVMRPDKPWERRGENPMAYPFSDGVWYDPSARLFKLWYYCGNQRHTGYAQSHDGIHWEKPVLDIVRGTNIVMAAERDSTTVWMDLDDPDSSARFKMLRIPYHSNPLMLHTSPDGIRWSGPLASSIRIHDRTTAFFDPFRRVWVLSIRADRQGVGRARQYYAHADVRKLFRFKEHDPVWWTQADSLDPVRDGVRPELYNLDVFAYESLLIGMFAIWQGHPPHRHKVNEVFLGFTRNGFDWIRPNRTPFLPVSETPGAWNWTNVQSAGGGCNVVGDQLYFYCSARSGVPGTPRMGEASTGLAILRRDGFVSLNAGGGGILETRLLRCSGAHLFVNLQGELSVEVMDSRGRVVAAPRAVKADSARLRLDCDLSALTGRAIRLKFHLHQGRLFSFWITPCATGASNGYVAAGGPGFYAHRDVD